MRSNDYSIEASLSEFGINCPELQKLITGQLVNDTRQVESGDIFAAVIGTALDGRQYIEQAINKGASAVISETQQLAEHGHIQMNGSIPVVSFYQLSQKLSQLAEVYYQAPAKSMTLVGITGTNGKTSCSQLIAQLHELCLGEKSAVIGTNGAGRLSNLKVVNNTTPGPTELQSWLAQFKTEQVSLAALEVSSHALEQHRLQSKLIDIAVFTNLSRDHLDYHGTMENYANAKAKLFTGGPEQVWVINSDDPQGHAWLAQLPNTNRTIAYGLSKDVTNQQEYLLAEHIESHSHGLKFTLTSKVMGQVQQHPVSCQLIGHFNVYNLLAAIACTAIQKVSLSTIIKHVESLSPVNGRMESYIKEGLPTTVVDYAHTPDALESALSACQQHCLGDLWLVFGCGGDRDKGKRALMGQIAEQYADHIILTNDNPRSEEPVAITNDIAAGIKVSNKVQVLIDRQQAVLSALHQAKKEDMVLCAGKGHEDYIIIGSEKIHYSERELVKTFYQKSTAGRMQ